MAGIFGGEADHFDPEGAFEPAHLPEPGPFLAGHDVLDGEEHVAFHALTRECFEARGVYDMTFGYNLARLNRDRRHPGAGYRYAVERADAATSATRTDELEAASDPDAPLADASVLRAEFTPTTPFCPQSDTLTVGSFRAWNGLADRHDYDVVRVRIAPMHHEAEAIDAKLRRLERRFLETGSLGELADPDRPSGGGMDGIDHGDPAEDAFF